MRFRVRQVSWEHDREKQIGEHLEGDDRGLFEYVI
jgi:hypothetical protein